MRKCLRCQDEMVENLVIFVSSGEYGIDVREKGIFKGSLGKIKAAVCPSCGLVEPYLEDLSKIQKLSNSKK